MLNNDESDENASMYSIICIRKKKMGRVFFVKGKIKKTTNRSKTEIIYKLFLPVQFHNPSSKEI